MFFILLFQNDFFLLLISGIEIGFKSLHKYPMIELWTKKLQLKKEITFQFVKMLRFIFMSVFLICFCCFLFRHE